VDLTKACLPDSVEVSGRLYKIHTGHSYWFRFSQILDQEKKYLHEFDHLYVDEVPEDRQAGVDALAAFFYEKKELPRVDGESGPNILDYTIDADLLYAGIIQCYGIDLMEKQYHWHIVRALIGGLEGTKLNTVIGFRCAKPGKNKELARMQRMWALPEKESESRRAELESIESVFYGAQFGAK
jgi:hypothetical protein